MPDLKRLPVIGLSLLIVVLSSACNTPPVPPAPAIVVTFDSPALATLPPTWTPAPTDTPAPTVTPPPTETTTPTLSAAGVCQSFQLISSPASNAQIAYDGMATYTWLGLPPGATLTIVITLHNARAGLRIDASAPVDGAVPVPMLRLPQEGQYDWQLWLQTGQADQQLCIRNGTFTRLPLVMM